MISMSMGYPELADEIEIAKGKSTRFQPQQLFSVLQAQELKELQDLVEQTHIHDNVYKYIVKLVEATRNNQYIELGVSPRGTIACTRMAKARAFLQGRSFVLPEDVADVFKDIARHRIVLNTKARVAHVKENAVLDQILEEVKQPTSYMKRNEYRA